MNILDAKWLVIDTETTGPDPAVARIVELGAVPFDGGRAGQRMGTLINPGVPIPDAASAVHGISSADIRESPRLDEVDERFLAHVRSADVLVGYNFSHFDAPILQRSIGPRWDMAVVGKPVIDPLVIVRLDSVGRFWKGHGRHKLTSVCERLHIPRPPNAHRATADCLMTGALLWHLLTRHKGGLALPRETDALEAHLRVHAARQQADFDRWRASQRQRGDA
ncbi:MAG: hypothetical protein AMXMBFR64_57470 [Myxococcales bacterium]